MFILGINAAYHDSSAALVSDGQIVAAAEEERFTRVKHAKRPNPFTTHELPYHALDYCLSEAGIDINQVEHIAYAFDPSLLANWAVPTEGFRLDPRHPDWALKTIPWHPAFSASIWNAPLLFRRLVPLHLEKRLRLSDDKELLSRWQFVPHHLCHAGSAFLPSPFTRAAILTLDGVGEYTSAAYGLGEESSIKLFKEVSTPISIGLLYEAVTAHLGFLRSSDEGKVMAMASYGSPYFLANFEQCLVLNDDGTFKIDGLNLEEMFGEPRQPGSPLEQKHYDIAASLQEAVERLIVRLAHYLHTVTQETALCMAGGVALNCLTNSRIRRETPFKQIFIQPAAGDAGTALGAALVVAAQLGFGRPAVMEHAYLGPGFNDDTIENILRRSKLPYRKTANIPGEVARLLANQRIVGWFQGRMELGPRALGARSILASPTDPTMVQKLNEIKGREFFRPVAPVVLEEAAPRYFADAEPSPFMLFAFDVLPEARTMIPAACHVDGTARIQTISKTQSPLLYSLIKAFSELTGISVVINTSFNVRQEPIVCTPEDAIRSYCVSGLDALAIGSFLLQKESAQDNSH